MLGCCGGCCWLHGPCLEVHLRSKVTPGWRRPPNSQAGRQGVCVAHHQPPIVERNGFPSFSGPSLPGCHPTISWIESFTSYYDVNMMLTMIVTDDSQRWLMLGLAVVPACRRGKATSFLGAAHFINAFLGAEPQPILF